MEKETKVAAVSMKNITKTFGSVIANDKVNLDIYKGEILSLLGENGSGKTTLMNMLSGIYFPDEGQIFINGKEEVIRSPKDALRLGIGMVHQHFKLIDVLSATENIILGLEGRLNIKEASRKIEEICNKYGFEVDPKQKIYDMSVSQKQTVEIVKVLYRGADILILDEPTAVLTPQETEKLFNVLRKMRDDGKAIVIITHKMHEVESLSDRVAVLRNGQYIGSMLTKDTTVTEMTNMMVGHAVTLNIERPEPVNPKPRIEVEGLMYNGIWPPSKPGLGAPERAFWPLCPLPAVLPFPEACPRPLLKLSLCLDPSAGCKLDKFITAPPYLYLLDLFNFYQMSDILDHASNCTIIRHLNSLVHLL